MGKEGLYKKSWKEEDEREREKERLICACRMSITRSIHPFSRPTAERKREIQLIKLFPLKGIEPCRSGLDREGERHSRQQPAAAAAVAANRLYVTGQMAIGSVVMDCPLSSHKESFTG
jgi:hypothetical protein